MGPDTAPCSAPGPAGPSRHLTAAVVRAIDALEAAVSAPLPRCPEGAREHHDRRRAARNDLARAILDYAHGPR